ncbi:hypothetical protein F220043C3_36500 [Enterocloster asparagiformis]|uniref:hypothetical protein n=1 Tax=Enterocloster asparagiformis TaxID=333367 RepID=UPI002354435E
MKKPLFLVPLLALLLSACSSSSSYFSAFTAEGSQTQYKQTGTVHIKDDENAVSLYVNAASPAAITLTGKLSSSSGDPSLICQYPDGAMYLIADSRTTSLDTEIPLQAGLNQIRFDGSDSVLDFELVYTGLNSPEILGYGQSQSEAETVPADAASISTGIPGSSSTETDLHGSSSNLFTKVSQPATLLEFQLEKETDITVFVAVDLRNNGSGRFKAGVFDVTLKSEDYPDAEILHHATADSSWGDFLWTDHNLAKLTLPKGSYQLILSKVSGKNYALRLDTAVYPTDPPQ